MRLRHRSAAGVRPRFMVVFGGAAPGCGLWIATVGREADGLRFEQLQHGPDGEIWSVVVRLRIAGPGCQPSGLVGLRKQFR
jgi:hypothetical protein